MGVGERAQRAIRHALTLEDLVLSLAPSGVPCALLGVTPQHYLEITPEYCLSVPYTKKHPPNKTKTKTYNQT